MAVRFTSACAFCTLCWRLAFTMSTYNSDFTRDQPRAPANEAISYLTGELYNPMDPMGYIFGGNGKQYTLGNGKDTHTFDPAMYAYMYKGNGNGVPDPVTQYPYAMMVQSNMYDMNIFQPPSTFLRPQPGNPNNQNSGSKQTDNASTASRKPPNNTHGGSDGEEQSATNRTKTEHLDNQTEMKKNILDSEHKNISRTSNSSKSIIPVLQATSQADHGQTDINTTISTNANNTHDQSMLGSNGRFTHPYIPKYPSPVNFTGESNLLPVLVGRPGSLVSEYQSPGGAKDFYPVVQNQTTRLTSVPDPIFSGYPGMLGVPGLVENRNVSIDTFLFSTSPDTDAMNARPNKSSAVNPSSAATMFAGPSVVKGILTNLNVNSWKGDWPGQQKGDGESEKEKTDNWYDGWTTKETGGSAKSNETKPNGGSAKSSVWGSPNSGSGSSWDGSWPDAGETVESNRTNANSAKTSVWGSPQSGLGSSSWDGSWPGRDSVLPVSKEPSVNETSSSEKPLNPDELKVAMQVLGNLAAYLKGLSLSNEVRDDGSGNSRAYSDMAGDWAKDIRG